MFEDIPQFTSDETLIAEALAGHKPSLEKLIRRHQDYIYNIALKLFLHPEDALDATQEVLIKVVTHLKTFKGESHFRTWLYRITFNHFLNVPPRKMERLLAQHDKQYSGLSGTDDNQQVSEEAIEEVRIMCATAMLMCLDREQRLVYIIGEVFGADHHMGAELFETTPANYRVKLYRAKKDLVQFVTGKCGLINPENPCRCHKKAKAMVAQGVVDKNNMLFNTDFKQKISGIVANRKNEISDNIQLRMQALFQDTPFQIKEKLDKLLNEIII